MQYSLSILSVVCDEECHLLGHRETLLGENMYISKYSAINTVRHCKLFALRDLGFPEFLMKIRVVSVIS